MTAALIDLPPRGLSLLHANLPQARQQVEALSDIVIASGLKNIVLNVECGGGFGWDPGYLRTLVQKYSQGGRVAHVLFYLTNGPAARKWPTTAMEGFGTRISPEQFRHKILADQQFQDEFQELTRRLFDIIVEIHQAGGQASIVPQLEDNQTNKSFTMMLELIRTALPPGLPVRLGRNPCVSCYPGNEGSTPAGCFLEEHHHSASTDFTLKDGILSNDGCTYAFPGETPTSLPYLQLEKFEGVQSKTGRMNSMFILWSGKYQGLGGPITDPKSRAYIMPTEAEREILIEFLRKP